MSTVLSAAVSDESYIGAVDPRARIVAATVLSFAVVAVNGFQALGVAMAAGIGAALLAGLSLKTVLKRLIPLNSIMVVLVILLPLCTPGEIVWRLGPAGFSRDGFLLAAAVALKGNAVALLLISLLGTMDPVALGHAMSHLRVPEKLAHLLLFTVRYLEVLHAEYLRMRTAMKVRAFCPRMDRHTYRSFGYLAGMLLVRGFDRAERVSAAMKCRGFTGRFYILDHFEFSRRDLPFCIASAAVIMLMVFVEFF